MRWLFIVIGLYSGVMQAGIKPSSGVKHWLTKLAVGGVLSTVVWHGSVMAQQDDEPLELVNKVELEQEVDWRKVNSRSTAQHQSVFYLLIDLFDNWRVMPIVYLGNDQHGEALFVGARTQIVRLGRKVFRFGIPSLVSYQGLVRENVDVQEVASFIHPDDRYFDISVLKIDDVDVDEYQAVAIAPYPDGGQNLEMVAYRIDLADDLLHFFSYPSYVRECQSKARIIDKNDRQIVLHDCNVLYTPAIRGTPIFTDNKDEEVKLVALHYGNYRDELSYAVEIPQRLNNWLSLAVEARGKVVVTWGDIKRQAIEGRQH